MTLQIWCQAHNSHLTLKRWQPVFGEPLTQDSQPGPSASLSHSMLLQVLTESRSKARHLCTADIPTWCRCVRPCASLFALPVTAPFDLSGRTRILPHAEPEVDVDMTEGVEPKEKRPRITVTLPGGRSTPQQQQVGDAPSWVSWDSLSKPDHFDTAGASPSDINE
eukprot:jgi/Astpho2/1065/Aster-07448